MPSWGTDVPTVLNPPPTTTWVDVTASPPTNVEYPKSGFHDDMLPVVTSNEVTPTRAVPT